MQWATRDGRSEADIAVVAASIRLGRCLNLLDARYHDLVVEGERQWEATQHSMGVAPTKNMAKRGDRNCRVFNFIYDSVDVKIDTTRAVYAEGEPLFEDSGLFKQSHMHLCVRNLACILKLELFLSFPKD
jgi:hypothetical protein